MNKTLPCETMKNQINIHFSVYLLYQTNLVQKSWQFEDECMTYYNAFQHLPLTFHSIFFKNFLLGGAHTAKNKWYYADMAKNKWYYITESVNKVKYLHHGIRNKIFPLLHQIFYNIVPT